MRKLQPQLVPRSARTDFSWIFWDPTGERRRKHERERENTFLKHVPRWMRSSAFGSADANVRASPDVEAGVVQGPAAESDHSSRRGYTDTLSGLGRLWNAEPQHISRTSRSPDFESGTQNNLRHSSETRATSITLADNHNPSNEPPSTSVRMRKPTRRSSFSDDWQRGSNVIERAIRTDLFTSPAACNLINLFDPQGTGSAMYNNRVPKRISPKRLRGLERNFEQMGMSHGSSRGMVGDEEDRGKDYNASNGPPSTSVRMRKPSRRSSSSDDWQRGSDVIERAIRTDLFTSPAASNLVNLFDPCGTGNQRYTVPKPSSPKRLRGLDRGSERTNMRCGSSGATSFTTVDDDDHGADDGAKVEGLRVEKRRRKKRGEGGGGDGERQRREDLAAAEAVEEGSGSGDGSGNGGDERSCISASNGRGRS